MKKKIMLLACVLNIISMPSAFGVGGNDGPFMIRGRVISVIPVEKQDRIDAGGNSTIGKSLTPEVDLTFFFTENIAAEINLAASRHTIKTENNSVRLVHKESTWIVPPTLTLQYHFTNIAFAKPYVGAGINYTMFYRDKAGSAHHKNHSTLALQAGVDIPIVKNIYANIDVKKLLPKKSGHVDNDTALADIKMSPWIVGVGIGVRF